jgi:hypothetical protein
MIPAPGSRRINGHATPPPPARSPDVPTCPKRCDVADPPEAAGGDHYVCTCCGTAFTWRAP